MPMTATNVCCCNAQWILVLTRGIRTVAASVVFAVVGDAVLDVCRGTMPENYAPLQVEFPPPLRAKMPTAKANDDDGTTCAADNVDDAVVATAGARRPNLFLCCCACVFCDSMQTNHMGNNSKRRADCCNHQHL